MLIVTLSAHLLATGIPWEAKHMAEPGLQQTLDAMEGLVSEACLHVYGVFVCEVCPSFPNMCLELGPDDRNMGVILAAE